MQYIVVLEDSLLGFGSYFYFSRAFQDQEENTVSLLTLKYPQLSRQLPVFDGSFFITLFPLLYHELLGTMH